MKRLTTFLFIFIATFAFISAQETSTDTQSPQNSEAPIEGESEYTYTANQKGDQFMKINLMVNIPIQPKNLNIGGSGQLGYHYFFGKSFGVGGSISFGFSQTEGSNMFLFVPILAQATYQFRIKRFEFPLTLGIGGCFENYLDRTYFGLTIKPEVAAYFRYSSEWSFGVFSGLYIMPQWYSNSDYNYTGIVCDAGLSVRYHF